VSAQGVAVYQLVVSVETYRESRRGKETIQERKEQRNTYEGNEYL
jgi:hypothetical protein